MLGIYLPNISVKMEILRRKARAVLKIYGHLIIEIKLRTANEKNSNLENPGDFLRIFLKFCGTRSLHFRGLILSRAKIRFLRAFGRNAPSLKSTSRYFGFGMLPIVYSIFRLNFTKSYGFLCYR